MRKINFFKTFALGTVVALASCSQVDDFNIAEQANNESNAISFGTYMGKNKETRAGYEGSINTDVLKGAANGFGVFAYYTGTADYAQNTKANFMFNQHVTWDATTYPTSSGYITSWTYSPLKYWPNELASSGAVDDQSEAATTTNTQGGKVSFFAYAPHVDFPVTPTTDGIVAINGETALASANAKSQDPTITYKIATDGNVVDLLWGTRGTTTQNVLGSGNTGKSYNGGGTTYEQAILNGYTVNADLTKQKTNGTVDFAFKHALSKVGGSTTTNTTTTASPNGLMIVLDLDDLKGAETGGTKDGTTLVTVKSVTIAAKSYTPDASGNAYGATGYTTTYYTNGGSVFNLATGKWDLTSARSTTSGDAATTNHTINATGTSANATLATAIAENTTPTYSSGWSQTGVTTTAQNVYKEETNPFVFIPGTTPELTITIDYIVRTYDSNLSAPSSGESTCSKVEQIISKKVTFNNPVELNKQYNILMHLGLTGVKFTATVADWDVNGTDTNGNGVIEDGEITVTDANLPINVAP